jgi:hypothetical protein
MANDWYIEVGHQRLAELRAGRAQAQADLEIAKRDDDRAAASEALQNIADIDAAEANIGRLYNQYIQSQQPPPPPTLEERRAKPWEKMDYSDVWEMSKSKYGPPDEASFRAGIQEAQRRRARGE